MRVTNLIELYQYFDELVMEDVNSDILFASSYIRGFISLVSSQFGDETQLLTIELLNCVSEELNKSKSELTPQDNVIVNNYWLNLQENILN
ncbi:MAG: YfcL family protein [Colwelliaceae bacterium]|nr:YfcL family protein [Colwelliaceae bacterium]